MNYDTGVNLEKSTAFLQSKRQQGDERIRKFWGYRQDWAQQSQELGNPRAMIVHCLCISSQPIATYREWKENLAVDFNMRSIEVALEGLHKDRWISVRPMGKKGKWWQINCDLVALAEHMAQSIYDDNKGINAWETPLWGEWWQKDADFSNLPFIQLIGSDTTIVS